MRAPVHPFRTRSAEPGGCPVRGVRHPVEARGGTGSVATEIALLATLVAGVTVGVAAVIGVSVEHPLEALTAVLGGLTGSGG